MQGSDLQTTDSGVSPFEKEECCPFLTRCLAMRDGMGTGGVEACVGAWVWGYSISSVTVVSYTMLETLHEGIYIEQTACNGHVVLRRDNSKARALGGAEVATLVA